MVTERNQEPWDRGVFTSVGIDPARKRFLLLKSRMYFRPVFLPIAKGMVFCDALGVGIIGLDAVRIPQAAPADLSAGLGISGRRIAESIRGEPDAMN